MTSWKRSVGPHCYEICEECFQARAPLEEKTIGLIGGAQECDLCGKLVPRPEMHHVDGLNEPRERSK